MKKLQESPESCPSVTSVLNLMIDHSGNIVEDRGGPTMGGGDLVSPVTNIQEENKSVGDSPIQSRASHNAADLTSRGESADRSSYAPSTELSSVSATSHSNGRGCPKRVWTLTGDYLM